MTPADVVRFGNKVRKSRSKRECWLWQGGLDGDGYGVFTVGKKTLRAHRVAYYLGYGEEPNGRVLHKCGERRCCNPHHLQVGSAKENVEDMRVHGTLATGARNGSVTRPDRVPRGSASGASKLDERSVRAIKRRALEESFGAIARDYGVSKSTVSRIVNGKQWQHVR